MDTNNQHHVLEEFIRIFPFLLVLFKCRQDFPSLFSQLSLAVLDPLFSSLHLLWDGRSQGKGDAEEGTLYLPWFPLLPSLSLTCPFLAWWGRGGRLSQRCLSAEGLWGMAWLFLLHATRGGITRGRVIFLPDTSSVTRKMNFCPACMWCGPAELLSV